MTLPLVSVAIPAYNHSAFIEACLYSVCAQTYPELELVLIDDGSTDNTFEIARRFLETHPDRFRRVILERVENRGVSANSNACIETCRGEWVHLLGSDDVLHPDKVTHIQKSIDEWQHPNLAVVHADVNYIDEYGHPVTRSRERPRPPPGPEHQAYRWLFLEKHFIFNPTLTLHRKTFLSAGGFDRNLPLEDLDCWLRLSVNHAFARVPEILASYRKHPGNTSRKRLKMLGALFNTYAKFLATNQKLIATDDIRHQFRRNVWRFWRRLWKKKPWLYPVVIGAIWQSHVRTPNADDYRSFGGILDKAAR